MGEPSVSAAVDGISPPSGPPQHMGRHQEPAKRIDRGQVDGDSGDTSAKTGRIRHGKRYENYSELMRASQTVTSELRAEPGEAWARDEGQAGHLGRHRRA